MWLPHLYHWSPRERKPQIVRYGLRPNREPPHGEWIKAVSDGIPQICLATTPAVAWVLCQPKEKGVTIWDLWEVWIADDDEVRVLPNHGPVITEVRVANRIPKRRVRWIAERELTSHLEDPGQLPENVND